MQPHDALLPTMPAQPDPPDPRGPVQLHAVVTARPSSRALRIAGLVGMLLLGLVIGIAIGNATAPSAAAPPATTAVAIGQLRVSSKPAEGNVTVDGRFVGVSPIERVDLDPGKHSVVIDAFGYQPYAGTLAIDAGGKVSLDVLLAPIGGADSTKGNVSGGGGKATTAKIPASALVTNQPAGGTTAQDTATAVKTAPKRTSRRNDDSSSSPPARVFEPPPRPRRDCSGEKSRCRDGCSRAETDCRFSCNTCSSCLSSMGQDECRRQCESCRSSCERNTKFCESSCDSQYDNCQASNN
ncbi:MAG TPA: PEGA domain-containing protein [Kofleriaceae bacterium]|nr:PEGA domain-containing protein [Kofleriaceae bacterium]